MSRHANIHHAHPPPSHDHRLTSVDGLMVTPSHPILPIRGCIIAMFSCPPHDPR